MTAWNPRTMQWAIVISEIEVAQNPQGWKALRDLVKKVPTEPKLKQISEGMRTP